MGMVWAHTADLTHSVIKRVVEVVEGAGFQEKGASGKSSPCG